MFLRTLFHIIFIAVLTKEYVAIPHNQTKRFPDDFLFGVATAAYQIEGGWNADGKGPSIWDEYTHSHPEKIRDHSNGDVGPNSYKYFMDDIAAVKSLGMNFYRFSISWSRILPTGDVSNINEKGIEYYNKVIDRLLESNIEPMVTMYHYDLPQKLQTFGGFSNEIIVKHFEAYANLLFERFGDRVKYWITFNQPRNFCLAGYGLSLHAPAMNYNGIGEYLCVHNVLKAHALAYHLYKNSYYDRFMGQVGITISSEFFYSDTNDTILVDRALQFSVGWIAKPIFSSEGNYPDIMIKEIAKNSRTEGRSWSRLPTFSKEWIKKIRGSADFMGFNYYTSRYVEQLEEPIALNPSYIRDLQIKETVKPEWKRSTNSWNYAVPKGLGDSLRWIKKEYNNPSVFITENGWSEDAELEDNDRVEFLHDHLQQIQDIILNDECNLKGYTVWTVMDSFEWTMGYTEKYGLFSVNMSSPRKERTPRKSAYFMRTVTETRQIPLKNTKLVDLTQIHY